MGNPTRLLEAARLAGYWDKYVNYLSNVDDREDRIGLGERRRAQSDLFVYPFGIDLNFTDQRVQVGADQETWNNNKSTFANYTRESWNTGDQQVLNLARFRPAKLIIVTLGNGGQGRRTVSKRTGRPYLKYETTSRGIPFGRDVETKTEFQAFSTLKAGFTTSPTLKISRQKEKL